MAPAADSRKITFLNLAIVLALCFGSLTYGFSFSISATTLGQPSWYIYFDLTQDPTMPRYGYTNSIIGTMNGLLFAGGFLGAIFVGWACDALGRKKCLLIATPIAILAGALQAGAVNIPMFLVGRMLGGFAVGILIVLVPIFQSEVAPPSTRGFLVSQHGVVLVFGYSLAAWVGVATYYSKNFVFQWRFPLALQMLWPLAMFILTFFLPESPRWLLMKGRDAEAWAVIQKLHGSGNNSDSHAAIFAKQEFHQMSQQVAVDIAIARTETVWTLFTKPSYRKRMFCAFVTMFGTQSTGINVVYNYSILLYEGLGFSGSMPLILAAAYVSIACIGNYMNALLIDRVGRVNLLVIGCTGCMVCLIFESALAATFVGTQNHAGLSASVFFLFLYITFYGCCIDANTYVYVTEIFPSHIRARGVAWSVSILFLTATAYIEGAPTAFAAIAWKYYLVFIAISAIIAPTIYFTFPETKGLTLEEIGQKFGDEVVVHLTDVAEEDRELGHEVSNIEKSAAAEHFEVDRV